MNLILGPKVGLTWRLSRRWSKVTEQGQGHMNIIIINMALNKKWGLNGDIGGHLKFKLITKKYIFLKKPLFLIWLQFCKPEGNCFRSITSWRQFYILQNGNLSKLIQRNTVLSFKNLIYYKEEIFLTQGKSFCASSYILDVFQAVWLIKSLKRVLLGFSSSINGE